MNKSQSFGIDILIIIIGIIVMGELLLVTATKPESGIYLQRVENQQLLYTLMNYNNSILYFDTYLCSGNKDALAKFNKSVEYVINMYRGPREYLFIVNGLNYSSEGLDRVCLKEASPAISKIKLSCNADIVATLVLYRRGDRSEC